MGEVVNLVELRAAAEADADDFIRGLEMITKAIDDAKREPGGFRALFESLSQSDQALVLDLPALLTRKRRAIERQMALAKQRKLKRGRDGVVREMTRPKPAEPVQPSDRL